MACERAIVCWRSFVGVSKTFRSSMARFLVADGDIRGFDQSASQESTR